MGFYGRDNEPPKIEVIEGPTPDFEAVSDGWALSMAAEYQALSLPILTRLRSYNAAALVERCYHAWHNKQEIRLHYRQTDGTPTSLPIISADKVETSDGDVLLLWLAIAQDQIQYG